MRVANIPGKLFALSLVGFGALIIAAFYYQAAGGNLPFSGKKYTVSAVVREPQGLVKDADVRAAGLKVGKVSHIDPLGGGMAKVEMKLRDSIAPIYRDATVLVRQKTLVGENYIELTRGHQQTGTLPDGAGLPVSQDQEAVPLDKILNSLDARTRSHISHNLQSLGAGFDKRGSDFNRILAGLNPALSDGSRMMNVLQAQRRQIADILDQAGTIFQAISERRADFRALVTAAKTTAQAVAARDTALKEAFHQFPGTLSQANSTVARLSSFSNRATPVVANLTTGLAALRQPVRDLKPTADAGRQLFSRLPALLKVADPMLTELRSFSKTSTPTFPALDALLRQVNPFLDYLKPYDRDIGAFLMNFAAHTMAQQYGTYIRCSCAVTDRSFGDWNPAMRAAVAALLDEGLVAKYHHVATNPLRGPGQLPNAGIPWGNKPYPRIQAAPPSGR